MATRKNKTNNSNEDKTMTDNSTDNKELVAQAPAGEVANFEGFAEYEGQGFENQTAADYKLPFLNLLQALSPQCQGRDAVGKAGMLYDSADGSVYDGDKGVLIVPATTEHCYVAWKPARGGFAGKFAPGSDVVTKASRVERQTDAGPKMFTVDAHGNDLTETFYIYAVMANEEGIPLGWTIIANTSIKIGSYKDIMGKVRKHLIEVKGRKINPPLFANLLRVTSFWDTKPKLAAYNIRYSPAVGDSLRDSLLAPNHPLFLAAKELKTAVESGLVSGDMEKAGSGGGSSEVEAAF